MAYSVAIYLISQNASREETRVTEMYEFHDYLSELFD